MKCPVCFRVFKKASESYILDHVMKCSDKQAKGGADNTSSSNSKKPPRKKRTNNSKKKKADKPISKSDRTSVSTQRSSAKKLSPTSPTKLPPRRSRSQSPDDYIRRTSSRMVPQTTCPICMKVFDMSEISMNEVNRHINLCSEASLEASHLETSPADSKPSSTMPSPNHPQRATMFDLSHHKSKKRRSRQQKELLGRERTKRRFGDVGKYGVVSSSLPPHAVSPICQPASTSMKDTTTRTEVSKQSKALPPSSSRMKFPEAATSIAASTTSSECTKIKDDQLVSVTGIDAMNESDADPFSFSNSRRRKQNITQCPICQREFNLYITSTTEVNTHINQCFEKQQSELLDYEQGKKTKSRQSINTADDEIDEHMDQWRITTSKTPQQSQVEQEKRGESLEFLYQGSGKKAMQELMLLYC